MIPLRDRNIWIRALLILFAAVPVAFIYSTIRKGEYTFRSGRIIDEVTNPTGYYFGLIYMGAIASFLLYAALLPNKKKRRRNENRA